MTKIISVGDMRRQKVISDMIKFPEKKPVQMPTHPDIGVLMRKGNYVFYAFINDEYTEGTVDQLESALQLTSVKVAKL